MSFEQEMVDRVKQTLLQQIGDCEFIEYHHSRKQHVPQDIIDKAWACIDWDTVTSTIKTRLQDAICATVVNAMLTETKTDVKKVLAIQGVREKLRAEAYPKIMNALEQDDQ